MRLATISAAGVFALWIAAVLDPIGKFFYLRYAGLGIAGLCLLQVMLARAGQISGPSLRGFFFLLLCIVMPVYGTALYAVRGRGGGDFTDTSYIASGVLFLFAFLYFNIRTCDLGIRVLVVSLRLLTVLIMLAFLWQLFGLDSDSLRLLTENDVAVISQRSYGGVDLPYIYFLASPMLIYLIAYELYRLSTTPRIEQYALVFAASFAFAISGTRAHMLLALAMIPIYYLLQPGRSAKVRGGVLLLVGVSVLLITGDVLSLVGEFFSPTETSNAMKLALLVGYADLFNEPRTFFWGHGYNAHEWSGILRAMVALEEKASKTELTYLELVRVYGIILGGVFVAGLAVAVYRASQLPARYRWLYPALLVYLINSAFNPYLFSTNGMLPLSLVLSVLLYARRDEEDSSRASLLRGDRLWRLPRLLRQM